MRRRLLIACLALFLLAAAGALIVHTPPVRSFALRYVVRMALSQGIGVEAERLDYNLLTRNIRLVNIRVSAAGDAQPFFTAASVVATASGRVFSGEIGFEHVSVESGTVHVVRRADGTTNLPKSSGGTAGNQDPAPLPVERVSAPRLAIDYRDEAADVTLRVPAVTVDLSSRGRLSLEAPADLSVGSTSTRVGTFQSDAAFDGRDLRLSNLRIEAPEIRGQMDGLLSLIRREPSMDIRVSVDTALENAARWWGQAGDPPRGSVHLEGTVSGPLAVPEANLQLTSSAVSWQRLDLGNISGRLRLDGDSVEIGESRASIAGGEVNASGDLAWQGGRARVKASWRDIDAARLVAAAGGAAVTPSGRASGDLTASGSIDSLEGWTVDARLGLDGGQRGRGRLPAPGEARFRLAAGEWGLEAHHRVGDVAPVDVSLMGRLRGPDVRNSSVEGTLHVSESDLQTIFQMLSETGLASVQQDLVAGSIRATADVAGTLGEPILNLVVESDRATVAGQALAGVQARGRFSGSTFNLEQFSAAQPTVPGDQDAAGRVQATGQYDLKRQEYTGTFNATSWRIVPTSDVPLSGLIDVEYSGRGRGRMLFGKARMVSNVTVSPDVELGEIIADAELLGDRATITARAPAFNATADVAIGLDPPYPTTLRAEAKALDLARALKGIQVPVALDGTTDLGIEASGSLERWRDGRASLEVAALDGHVQTLPVTLRAPARLQYDDGRVTVERLEATVGKTSVSVAGSLPASSGGNPTDAGEADAVLATLTGDLYDVAVAAAVAANATPADSTEPPITAGKGPLVLLARLTGSLESPTYTADLEIGPGMVQARADLAPVENLLVRAHLENGLLELRDLAGTYHGATVSATGQAPLSLLTGGTLDSTDSGAVLRATAVGVTAAVLSPFVDDATISQVGGSLDAKLDLSTRSLNLNDVQGEVVLERLNLEVEDLPVTQRMPTRIVARDGVARIESWVWESEGTSFELTGQVGIANRQAAILANGKLDARLLTPFFAISGVSTAGQIETRLSVTGPLTDPTVNGDVSVASGELRVRDPRIVAGDLNATAVLARGSAFITALNGTVNGGKLSGSGQIQYSPDIRGAFTANVTGMAMNFPEGLRTEIDSSLELTTEVKEGQPSNRLSGLVTIKRGAYREPLALLTGILGNLQRTGTATGSPPSPFLQSLALDVRVVTDADLVIDNNVAKAQLGVDLRVINVASAPALSGRAELREGGRLFLGRNAYTLQNGSIDFDNPSMIEPRLTIDASTRVRQYDIQIRITGTPDTLMTELTSPTDPTLDQPNLTSLLLTGRPLSELTGGQAAEIGAQVLGNLGGDVLGFAGRAVGLDTLRLGGAETNPRDPADLASQTDPTQRVTFGKSLGSTLDVTLSQSLRESNDQTWIIDYLPFRRIAFRFVSDDDDLRSYAFRHDVTFGAPAAIRSGDVSRTVERPRVSSVRLTGDLRVPEAQVRSQLRLKEGDRFDFIDWQDDRDRLERFYQRQQHFAVQIRTDREESAEGVALSYAIEAGPDTRIRVMGMTLPDRALREIETAWTQSVFEGFLVEEAEEIVRRELALQATYQPSLEVRVEGDESVRTLVVDVTPGPRAQRIDVRLDGIDEQLRSNLLDEVGDRQRAQQALTDPREYERTVLTALRARGYAQASVVVGAPIFEETLATVPVTVTAGPQFRLATLTFERVTALPLADLRVEAGLEEGALYRADAVEAARGRLQTRYRREGFSTASFTSRETIRPADAAVDVVFSVGEGPRQVIQEITVDGLRQVAGDVARGTLRLKTGDPLRTADWLEARRRLFESGLFRRVDIRVEPLGGTDDTAPVRLRVNVEEWPALRLRYGFQVAEERPEENVNGRDLVPGLSADLTRRTLFGRAVTVGAAVQYESLERLGRLFVNTPTFFGQQVQSSLALERSREESRLDTIVSDITTAAWEQRGRWGRLSASYGLRFERNRTFDTKPTDPDFAFDLTVHIGRLTSSVAWDSRDDPSDTTRGTFVSTSLEHGSTRLGSDLLFLRSLTQAYHFRPWKSVVFASAARYGAVKPLEGQVLVSSLRFFAGGARTVRGVPEDSLGGLDFFGDPVGGRGLLTLNEEVRFPMYRWLRGVAFLDTGNVFPEVSGIRVRELVGSTGFGLRVVTPFALFRVDYGRTIWNGPADNSGRWVFGIGQTF
jgi:outer membrane protein assembly factor BamA/autotransporter translocation and assembly factor TamB